MKNIWKYLHVSKNIFKILVGIPDKITTTLLLGHYCIFFLFFSLLSIYLFIYSSIYLITYLFTFFIFFAYLLIYIFVPNSATSTSHTHMHICFSLLNSHCTFFPY